MTANQPESRPDESVRIKLASEVDAELNALFENTSVLIENQRKLVAKAIDDAVRVGKWSCVVGVVILTTVREELQQKGYSVLCDTKRTEISFL